MRLLLGRSHPLIVTAALALAMVALFTNVCQASLTGGYMQVAQGSLTYLRLTQVGDRLNGYLQLISADATAPDGFATKQIQVSGIVSGASFSLTGGLPCEGSRTSGRLSLQFPSNDGRTSTCVLSPTSAEGWNRVVAGFQKRQRLVAYRKLWSDALWGRLRQIADDDQAVQNELESINNSLPGKLSSIDRLRAQEKRASDEKAIVQRVLSGVEDRLKARIEVVQNPDSNKATLETARRDASLACAAAVQSCGESAARCDAGVVRGEFVLAEAEFSKAGAELRKADEAMNLSDGQQDQGDASYHRGTAEYHLGSADYHLGSVEYHLGSVQYHIDRMRDDIKDEQTQIDRDMARVQSASARITEDTNYLKYLSPQMIGKLLGQFDRGVPAGTVIASTTIREHPRSTSTPLYRADPHTRLAALAAPQKDWSPVLLPNSKLGWIQTSKIRMAVYPLDADARQQTARRKSSTQRKHKN